VLQLSGLALALALAIGVVACGGGGGDDDATATPAVETTTSLPDRTPVTPVGPLSDREYLAVICSGLEEYTAAIIREQTVDGIRDVVLDYIASLEAVLPPEDLAQFHGDLIAYLTGAVESPTDLLALPRPLPPDDVRERLSDLENDIEECRSARFFSEREEDD
jgi:hypothetical protein